MRQIPSPGPSATASAAPALPPQLSAKCDVHMCPWWPYSNSKDFKANTVLVVVFLLCTLICGLAFNSAIRYLCIRRRRARTPENLKAELGCASAQVPALIYSEGMKLAGAAAECAICLSEFVAGERIRVLEKCGHGFHVQCIERWLLSHSSCPTCRANSQ